MKNSDRIGTALYIVRAVLRPRILRVYFLFYVPAVFSFGYCSLLIVSFTHEGASDRSLGDMKITNKHTYIASQKESQLHFIQS